MATYALIEDGYEFGRAEADDPEEALDTLDLSTGAYDTSGGTVWARVYARNVDDRVDSASRTFTIHPDEPPCAGSMTHDWQAPYEILGGCEKSPGVWGHGGGVIIHEVCMHCGCERKTDTWAQDPEMGKQGLRSVAYEPGKYADELRGEADE